MAVVEQVLCGCPAETVGGAGDDDACHEILPPQRRRSGVARWRSRPEPVVTSVGEFDRRGELAGLALDGVHAPVELIEPHDAREVPDVPVVEHQVTRRRVVADVAWSGVVAGWHAVDRQLPGQSGDLLDVVEVPEGEGERKLRDEIPRGGDVSQARGEAVSPIRTLIAVLPVAGSWTPTRTGAEAGGLDNGAALPGRDGELPGCRPPWGLLQAASENNVTAASGSTAGVVLVCGGTFLRR